MQPASGGSRQSVPIIGNARRDRARLAAHDLTPTRRMQLTFERGRQLRAVPWAEPTVLQRKTLAPPQVSTPLGSDKAGGTRPAPVAAITVLRATKYNPRSPPQPPAGIIGPTAGRRS